MYFFSIFLLITCWAGYFLIHSLTSSNATKAWVRNNAAGFHPFYRLGFNFLAILLLIPPLTVLYLNNWPTLWQWPDFLNWLQLGLAIFAIGGFLLTFRMYSGMDFLGITQVRRTEKENAQQLTISSFHRFVRHPWYFLALVFLWSRDVHLGLLVTNILVTLYFIIGSRLEENKLIEEFGERYLSYTQQVPGLIPRPWKMLSREDAAKINQ